MKRVRAGGAVVLLGILLGACAAPRPVPEDRTAAWQDHRAKLAALDRWRAEGRLTVDARGEGGQAGFTWIEPAGSGFRLRLGGPFGRSGARLVSDAGGVVLETGRGRRYRGGDARRLLADLYGWQIPVAGLRQWLLGLPAGSDDFTLDRFGRLETLQWQDWRVEYARYRPVDGLDLPVELSARRADGARLRVVVDAWSPGAGEPAAPSDSPVPLIGG
jgi:outer membrane lipoprotein LolB